MTKSVMLTSKSIRGKWLNNSPAFSKELSSLKPMRTSALVMTEVSF
jgi:hypothetical protein